MPEQTDFPPIPDGPLQEGARWRHHKPTSEQVAAWFATVPLDEGMSHGDYVGGVVLIPSSEKVKYTRRDGRGTVERFEQVFSPYVQVATRVAYFRRLAEHRGLIPRVAPADVPRSNRLDSIYFNGNLPDGFWYHVVQGEGGAVRYLCCSMIAQMFEPSTYGRLIRGERAAPVLEGIGVKQGTAGLDPNGTMKVMTGAIGRALAAAGILVAGTGFASADDMQEFAGLAAAAPDLLPPSEIAPGQQPAPVDAASELEGLRARAMALQTEMRERAPQTWQEFTSWYTERKDEEGWSTLNDVPPELMKAIISRMETLLAAATAS